MIKNFLGFTISILKRPEEGTKTTSFLWLFLEPLSAGCWIMVLISTIVAALVLATLKFFSLNHINYGFIISIFVTFGCLLQGLTVSPPNRWSSRFMLSVWWFFVLFFVIIYIANFAAMRVHHGIIDNESGFKVSGRRLPFSRKLMDKKKQKSTLQ